MLHRDPQGMAGIQTLETQKRTIQQASKMMEMVAGAKVKELTRESRSLAGKAKEIEDSVYDLKNKKPVVDTRTPEERMDIIETKGQEIVEALATLCMGEVIT